MHGLAITSESLDAWKGFIIHEMSHVIHYDTAYRFGCAIMQDTLLFGIWVRHANGYGNYAQRLCASLLVSQVTDLAIGYQQEYRADSEVIQRVTDPAILHALSYFFQLHASDMRDYGSFFYHYFLDEHPTSEKRWARFQEAYERLVNKR
mgnify:CR=1 FL=1